jgi:hypothetical protein
MKIFVIGLIGIASATGFAANAPLFKESFSKFQVNNTVIHWVAPTNQLCAALWTYKVTPQHFKIVAVSNLITMGSFTMQDEQHGHRVISSSNEDTLFFFSKERVCNLTVVPPQGRIEYWDGYAAANHWDKTNHFNELVDGLPSEVQTVELGLKLLKQFGINRTDLAQKSDGHLITFGETKTRSYFDRRTQKYIDNEILTRGIFLNRQIDGVAFAGIGLGGGCEIEFGNHGKIARFNLIWRDLQPYEHYKLASRDEIAQLINDGKAVLTHKNMVNPNDVKTVTITEISPLYMGASENESQDFVYPFAKLEATAETGYTNIDIELYCPILSTNIVSSK